MSMIKETNAGKAVDDTLEIVRDFRCQIPFWEYQPTGYRDSEAFASLIPELDAYLEKLFAGSIEIDDGNGDILDSLICDRARENVKYLLLQQVEKRAMLKSFEIQRQGARQAFEDHLAQMETFYAVKLAEREDLCNRYFEDKFEGGKNHV